MQPISLSTSQEVSLDSFSERDPNVDTKKIVNPLFEKLRTLSPFDNLIDMNIVNFIFSFFDHSHFTRLRSLNKKFKEFADSPELYSPYIIKLKTTFEDYNSKKTKLAIMNTELENSKADLESDKEALIHRRTELTNQGIQLTNQLTELNDSWLGYFVQLINFESGCFSVITEVFFYVFPSIKEEIEIRNDLPLQISNLSHQTSN